VDGKDAGTALKHLEDQFYDKARMNAFAELGIEASAEWTHIANNKGKNLYVINQDVLLSHIDDADAEDINVRTVFVVRVLGDKVQVVDTHNYGDGSEVTREEAINEAKKHLE